MNRQSEENRCLLHAFRDRTLETPHATAVQGGGGRLSYLDLDRASDALARDLRRSGCGVDRPVALRLSRSPEMVVAILATFKAGGAYLPIALDSPLESTLSILVEAKPICVIERDADALPSLDGDGVCPVVRIDVVALRTRFVPELDPLPDIASDALAYVLYTSGSTGRPKGCMIEHGALRNRVWWMHRAYPIDATDTVLQKTPYTFDVSVWEFVWPLAVGARLVLAKPEGHRDPVYLRALMDDQRITVCHFVPSMFRHFLRGFRKADCASLRHVFLSGEALPYGLMCDGLETLPQARLHNLYGPTEAAIDVSFFDCAPREDGIVPIGEAIDGIELFIADPDGNPLPREQRGELLIAGVGLARGYLAMPELTEEKFPTLPIAGSERRVYRTGDFAEMLSDGLIRFHGRMDGQIKLRGQRIELGEIEAALQRLPEVDEAVVALDESDPNDPKLVAYCTGRLDGVTLADIRRDVGAFLADHCKPNALVALETMPATAHGKVDRQTLASAPRAVPAPASAPRSAVESGASGDAVSADRAATLLALCREMLDIPTLTLEQDFFDLGATSFTLLRLGERIDAMFGVDIPVETFLADPSVRGLLPHVGGVDESAATQMPASVTAVPAMEAKRAEPEAKQGVTPEPDDGASNADRAATLLALCREMLDIPTLTLEQDFFDLGATSFTLLRLGERIDATFGVDIPVETFLADPSVRGLLPHVGGVDESPATRNDIAPVAPTRSIFPLPVGTPLRRPTYRSVAASADVPSSALKRLLSPLAPFGTGDGARFLHASGGGKYPLRVVLTVFRRDGSGFDPGRYLISSGAFRPLRDGVVSESRAPRIEVFADLSDLLETYRTISGLLATLDLGYLATTLLDAADEAGLALCPAAPPDRASDLPDRYLPLAGFEVGIAAAGEAPDHPLDPSELHSDAFRQVERTCHARAQRPAMGEKISRLSPPTEDGYLRRKARRVSLRSPLACVELARITDLLNDVAGIDVLVHVKPWGLEGFEEGLYRLLPDGARLEALSLGPVPTLRQGFYPFNRAHFDGAGLTILALGDARASDLPRALHHLGRVGQTLLQGQPEIGAAVCPIGWINVDLLSSEIPDLEGKSFLHGFMIGAWDFPELAVAADEKGEDRAVALIGQSARFGECRGEDALWSLFDRGESVVRLLPEGRHAHWLGDDGEDRVPTYGAWFERIDLFDAARFGIAPPEARTMDPQERLVLEEVHLALESAGYVPHRFARQVGKVGVFVGAMWQDYAICASEADMEEGEVLASAALSTIANHVAHHFDFDGPCLAIDTGCCSALSALDQARRAILDGRCAAAVVAGVSLCAHPYHRRLLMRSDLLTSASQSAIYGADAQGWLFGEGVGAIVLRASDDASGAGDPVRAMVIASISRHRGKTRLRGMPDSAALARIMVDMFEESDIDVSDIQFVEAAAGGAVIADTIEVAALDSVMADTSAVWPVSSSKGSIGHAESASGIGQLIKTVRQIEAGHVAPAILGEPLSRKIPFRAGTLFPADTRISLPDGPRCGLVNGFSAEGVSAHAVLRSPPPAPPPTEREGMRDMFFPVSAGSEILLRQHCDDVATAISTGAAAGAELTSIAATLAVSREPLPARCVLRASTRAELVTGLRRIAESGVGADRCPDRPELDAWRDGQRDDWPEALPEPLLRAALPGRPFEPTSHWIREREAAASPPRVVQGATDAAERLADWLVNAYAQASEIDPGTVTLDTPLDELGLSSIVVARMAKSLAERGIGDGRESIWFSAPTLRAVAEGLGGEITPRAPAPAIGGASAPSEEDPDASAIAVVGLSGRWPGGEDLDTFWKLLTSGESAIGSVDPERGDWRQYLSEGKGRPGRTYTTAMGALSRPYRFDTTFFGITPREAALIDPQERVFMEMAWSAVEDAGFAPDALHEQGAIGVFVGVMNDTFERVVAEAMDAADACAPQTNRYWSIANRVSFQLNLSGPSLAVDTACSSGLAAVHLAMQSLRGGETAMAIAGGVNLILHPGALVARSMLGMLSPDGQCSAFGSQANGTVVSEGCGAMLLAPLTLAQRLGCHIHGVLRGSAVNSGGRTNGYTMPNAAAQTALIRRALADARLTAADITCLEAHGTGTDLGDPLEFDGLRDAFAGAESERDSCSLGSVKVNIGHAESAAGIAALTKVMLQLRHGQYVPGVAPGETSARVNTDGTPFVLHRSVEPWPRPSARPGSPGSNRRRAGVSSFGAGGTNVHVILEEAIQAASPASAGMPRLLPISAKTPTALRRIALELADAIKSGRVPQLDALAFTLCVGRTCLPYRAFVHVDNLEDAADTFARIARGEQASELHACGHRPKGETAIDAREGAERVRRALDTADLEEAGRTWLRSAPFHWADVLDFTASRLSLPAYPFEGDDHRPASGQSQRVHRAVPLDVAQSLLEQHRVAGRPVCAGVVLADLAARALSSARGREVVLTDVIWHTLLGPQDGAPTLRLLPTDDARERFEIVANESVICSGEIERDGATAGSSTMERADVMAGAGQPVDIEQLYHRAEKGGLRYGPIFRQLRSLAVGEGRGVAVAGGLDAGAPDAERRAGMLDAGLQAAAAVLIGSGSADGDLIPARISRFACDPTLPDLSQIFVLAHAKGSASCDVLYTALDGREVARIDGVTFHVRPSEAVPSRPPEEPLVCTPVWSTLATPSTTNEASGAVWIIAENDAAVERAAAALPGKRLVAILRGETDGHGGRPRIDPDDDPQRLETRIRDVVGQGFTPDTLLCWSDASSAPLAIEKELQAFFYPCLRLAGSLASIDSLPKHLVQLAVARGSAERPLASAMTALFDAISAEHPHSVGKVVLVASKDDMGRATAFALAQDEAGLYRSTGESWQRRTYEPYAGSIAASKIEGVQVVTGGLGAAARNMVSELLETTDARFLLVGRQAPGAEQREWLAHHRDRLTHAVADCTDAMAMRAALDAGRIGLGAIRGVFHAAGTNTERRIGGSTPLSASRVLAPKLFGFEILDRLTVDDPLEHFTVFSSLAGIAPLAGQAAYGFANLAMSGLVEAREILRNSGQRRGVGRSLLLPFLAGGGMSAAPAMLARLESTTGVGALDVSALAATVTASLGRDADVQAILPGDRQKIVGRLAERRSSETFAAQPAPRAVDAVAAPVTPLRERLIGYLRRSAATLTGVDEDHLDPETEFSEFGVDSVLLTQWATALSDASGQEILPTVFFEGFSIARLATKLADDHGAALEILFADDDPIRPVIEPAGPAPVHDQKDADIAPPPEVRRAVDLVGLACRFPGAPTADAFWELLKSGRLPTGAVPPQRWHASNDHAGLIEDVRRFDARFFGMSPLETEQMDPQQRHLIEVSWHAFEDAGLPISTLSRSRVGVFVGASTHDYAELTLAAGAIEAHGSTGTGQAFLSNRLSFLFDLKGPSQTIDTACSSALVALTRALDAIRAGRCDVALVAGVNLMLTGTLHRIFDKAGMLSPRGVCSSFSDDADGYVRSEGVGAVVLRARDHAGSGSSNVYGSVLGAAENHGGRAQSLTAPNPAAQADLLRDAYVDAAIDVLDVDCVETHGTGTSLGDPVELEGLKLALGPGGTAAGGTIALGALKSQIGHMEAAAGIGGLIKVALSMRHESLPANCNFRQPNPYLRIEETPFRLQTETGEWSRSARAERPRRAGVSSFGIGGSNAHVVLEAPQTVPSAVMTGQPYLFVVSAKTEDALQRRITDLAEFLRRHDAAAILRDVSYTLAIGRDHFPKRWAFVAADRDALIAALDDGGARSGREDEAITASLTNPLPTDSAHADMVRLSGMAAAYKRGDDLDFAVDLRFDGARIMSLPGYPFAGREYWLATADTGSGLVEHTSGALPSGPIRLAVADPLLAEHVVLGRPLLPGMVSAAAALGTAGQLPAGIRRIRWCTPLHAGENGLEIAVEAGKNEEHRLNGADGEAAVEFSVGDVGSITREDLRTVPERTESADMPAASELYAAFTGAGIDYGPGYRLVTHIQRGPAGIDGWLRLPEQWSGRAEWVRRGVSMDGALHLVAVLEHEPGTTARGLSVPVSLDAIVLWDTLPETLFVRVTSAGIRVTDLDLYTVEGRHVGAIRGYRTHRIADTPAQEDNVVLMGRSWVQVARGSQVRRWRRIAILDADPALADLLAEALPDASVRRVSVRATGSPDAVFDPKDEMALHAILARWDADGWYPDLIVHALAKEIAGKAMDDLEVGLLIGVKSVFSCAKAAGSLHRGRETRIVCAYPSGPDAPLFASVTGLAHTIRAEHPALRMSAVDQTGDDPVLLRDHLLELPDAVESRVAQGAVFVPRLVRVG